MLKKSYKRQVTSRPALHLYLFAMFLLCYLWGPQCIFAESPAKENANKEVIIKVDPSIKYQTIEGFGEGSMDTFIPIWYVQFHSNIREWILDSLYTLDNDGLGLNICRFLMPVGDNPEHDHLNYIPPVANAPFEPEDGVFKWEGHENILWHAQGAQKRGAVMWAGWYSIPYWLAVSGCSAGSEDGKSDNLIAGKEGRFAKHICDVLEHFRDEWSVEFDYVSPVNEPEADWWKAGGGSPGSHVSAEQTIKIIKELSKQLKERGLKSKIQTHDAAYANAYWYLDILLKSEIEPLVSVISCHQYITSEAALVKWRERADQYKKGLWMTEWGDWKNAGYPDNKPYVQAMNYALKIHEGLKVLKANAWIIWEPAFLFDSNAFALTPRKSYWAVAHYTRHVRCGMQQIESESDRSECKTTAWVSPDGKTIVIITVNDSEGILSLEYNLSKFKNVKVEEVRLTSATDNYKQLSALPITRETIKTEIPSRSIMTISMSVEQ
jgi:O-glycosyl hydrolase